LTHHPLQDLPTYSSELSSSAYSSHIARHGFLDVRIPVLRLAW
jgi:hypothetical protein